jgi:hypothetical protein
MGYQQSPGVVWSEIDLTTVVPSASTTVGAISGDFEWGPVEYVQLVSSEIDLVSKYGIPTNNVAYTWWTAANFLAYANSLRVVRTVGAGATNASTGNSAPLIKNRDIWELGYSTLTDLAVGNNYYGFVSAKYPGSYINGLRVSAFAANVGSGSSTWTSWPYASYFPLPPGTSKYASDRGCANDEFHLVVVDTTGQFSGGVANTVIEKFTGLSKARDAKSFDGSSNYWVNVIADQSKFLWPTATMPSNSTGYYEVGYNGAYVNWGNTTTSKVDFSANLLSYAGVGTYSYLLANGAQSLSSTANLQTGYTYFSDADTYDISLIMMGGASNTVTQWVVQNIAEPGGSLGRGDCVVFCSPAYGDTINQPGNEVTNAVATRNGIGSSSYAFMDSAWKRQFDKYSNIYRWVPLNGDIAGLCAYTDTSRDPWYSPAGLNRGQIKNVTKLSWLPSKAERDVLYNNNINPVLQFAGQGTVLYGDKTLQVKPSAFDRINVRRLFIVLEKSISKAAKYSLFEFNDAFTRSQFVALVDPFLRDVKGRRGIYDYKIVCDETNNTSQVIDSNQFVGDIYIKPARSINFIQLNFVAVRSGVAFSEVVGKF